MIALTIRQPYASRIAGGYKTIENRSRPTRVRGQLLVHAGGMIHEHYAKRADRKLVEGLPRTAVVGAVNLVDVHNAEVCPDEGACTQGGGFRPTREDPRVFHWVLAHPILFATEIPRVSGQLGFWRPDDRVQDLAGMAIEESRSS